LCGVFAAGAAWSKNDGFALYLPGILAAILSFHLFQKEVDWSKRIKKIGYFLAGFAVVIPWLIFQSIYSSSVLKKVFDPLKKILSRNENHIHQDYHVLLTGANDKFENSPSSLELFWDHVFTGSTFGIFWIMIFLGLFLVSYKLLRDAIGRSLILFFMLTSFVIFYVFTFTPAYEYLLIQTTIHRVLLQFSAAALLVVGYGISLQLGYRKK